MTGARTSPVELRLNGLIAALVASIVILTGSVFSTTAASALGRVVAERVIDVPSGGDLQAALNQAQSGDTIRLAEGATYTGPYTLPAKSGSLDILIRTNASDSSLPPAGTRIRAADFPHLAKVIAASGSVFAADRNAGHYRFLGLEIAPSPGTFLYNVVLLGDGTEPSVAEQPHDISFERCYIHGDPSAGSRRGVTLNGRNLSVSDSIVSDFKEVGADSQAIAGWSGAGPFTIVNNELDGAGENVLFGGADPTISGLVPADIIVRHNHFFKPLTWKADDPSYAGTHWSVKNLFELKNARRVLIEGNVFEHNWADAQSGFAILFTVRNQDGTANWSQVDHVTFQNNILRHVGAAFNLLGYDNNFPSQQTNNISIRNNLLSDVTDAGWNGNGAFLQMLDGTANVSVDHNTVLHTGNVITGDGRAHRDFVFTNNIAPHNLYGVIGTNRGPGNDSLDFYFPGRDFRKNVIAGADPATYPTDNFYPANLSDVKFVDAANQNYRLNDVSPYKAAGTDAKDVGADIDAVETATCGAVTGIPCSTSGTPTPPPADKWPFGSVGGVPILLIVVSVALVLILLAVVSRRKRHE